ncbi:MAG: DoxX family protein [Candidatus Binatia bacterium]|nr:DoxX family protein [Candidatus Binatia bacterium]
MQKVYGALTGLVCVSWGASGIMGLTGAEQIMEGLAALGYPAYVATILGVWKLRAAVVLLAPGLPLIKEWCYSGLFFDLTGALASHLSERGRASGSAAAADRSGARDRVLCPPAGGPLAGLARGGLPGC